jgi:hypothetical protein
MKTHKNAFRYGLGLLAATALSACGGGGDDPPPPDPVFPLQAAYKQAVARGSSTDYTVSGTCSGSARFTFGLPSRVQWDGSEVLSVAQTAAIDYANCTPASSTNVTQAYYDLNYNPLATSSADGVTGLFRVIGNGLPLEAKVGDQGAFGTETLYGDSLQAVIIGRTEVSYSIDADPANPATTAGASTAIATLISKVYGPRGELLSTQQMRYRMSVGGGFAPDSIAIQYSPGSATQLVFTRKL